VWPATWVVWLAVLVVSVVRRQARWGAPLLAVFLVLPAFFLYMRFRSAYPFGDRYFSAFFGLGLVTVIAALDLALSEWRRLEPRLPTRARHVALGLLVLAFACSFSAPAFAYRVFADWRNIHGIPKNSSPYFHAYSELAQEHKPILIVQYGCFMSDIPSTYFRHILPPQQPAADWLELGCNKGAFAKARKTIQNFLTTQEQSGGLLVLAEMDADCSTRVVSPIPPPAHAERLQVPSTCMWTVSGVNTLPELTEVGKAIGFDLARKVR
jgi:hypothetical protein